MPESRSSRFLLLRLIALGVLLGGMIVTWAVVQSARQAQRAEVQARFDGYASRLEADIQRRMYRAPGGLKGLRAAYATVGQQLNRAQFRDFVASRGMATDFPGVRGFGFVERVPFAGLTDFIERERADGAPDFNVRTTATGGDLFVIKLIEPMAANLPAWGLDFSTEPLRREAAQRAIDTGEESLSAPIMLVQDVRRSAGWVVFVPVYRTGTDSQSATGRRTQLVGLLYAPIVAAELLEGTTNAVESQVSFRLYDGPATGGALAFDSQARAGMREPPRAATADGRHLFSTTRTLVMGGRTLSLHIVSSDALDAAAHGLLPAVVGLSGAGLSILLALSAWLLLSRRERAEALARSMTADLRRMAKVLERTSNAVFGTDARLHINWVNDGFTRITGYSVEEAMGKTPGELLGNPRANDTARRTLAQAAREGREVRVEILNRRKDGTDYWVETEIQPVRDEHGKLDGFIEIALDITERKHAEQQLHASEAFLEQAENIAGVGGWEVDLETGVLRISRQMRHLFGLPADAQPTTEDFIGFFNGPAQEHIAHTTSECIRTGMPWDLELPLTLPNGRKLWVRTVGQVERVNARSVRLIGILQDVTERRAMEEELRVNNTRMQAILHSLPVGLSVYDAELRLVAHNTRFRTVLGLPDDLFAGRVVMFEDIVRFNARRGDYGSDEVEQQDWAMATQARESRPHRYERMRPDGTHIDVRTAPMPDGGFVAVHTDITESKRAEAALQANEDLMRVVTDNIPGRVAYWDKDNRCRFVNRAYCESYGKTPDQLLGRTVLEVFGPKLYSRFAQHIDKAMEGIPQTFEREERDAHGNRVTTLVHYIPDAHGDEIRGMFVLALDVSQMRAARDLAVQASQAKSQFLANMSHEIRTPMNAILGMIALLQSTGLTARQADYVDKTEGAARALLSLLNDILDFSKVEAGKMTLDPRPFGIDDLLRDLSVILSASVGTKNVEVLFDVSPGMPARMVGDDMRLRQVLINLGGNAIKFTSAGEVVVRVREAGRTASSITLEFSVSDTGIGIAPEHQARIFSDFSQAEASTTRRFGGTGLGLAICQKLVTLMGGTLELQSEAGKGSRFFFTLKLPVAQGEKAASAMQKMVERVLIVDDNAVARDVLAQMAKSLGWHADLAESGQQALTQLEREAAAGNHYDAMFVDWKMPGMDGWETSQRIREHPAAGQAPLVVMVTAHGREMLAGRDATDRALLDGFLVKPVTASMLVDALAEARGMGLVRASPAMPAGQPLAGLRLLVVEDNANNQQVARELLAAQGAEVVLAADGREGVDKVATANPPYDAVLMDVQMPVMDGYTATREIRNTLGLTALPVIAMTANAMASDRAECLAAGMNDHVGKPFSVAELVATLMRHTGREAVDGKPGVDGPGGAPDAAAAAPGPESDGERGVDIDAAIERLGGNAAFYRQLVPSFRADAQSMAQRLGPLLAQGARADATRLAHTLKGLAGTMGAQQLAHEAAVVESQLAGPAGPGDAAAAARLAAQVEVALAALDAALAAGDAVAEPAPPQKASAAGEPTARNDLQQLLRQLIALLDTSDMQALDIHEQLRRDHGVALGDALVPLNSAMDALDFAAAAAASRHLLAGTLS